MILTVLAILMGTGIFFLINSMLDITYFGWFGCFIVSYAILTSLGGIVLGLLKWIVIGLIILFVIGLIANKIND